MNERNEQMSAEVSCFKEDYWRFRGGKRLLAYSGLPLKETLPAVMVKKYLKTKGAFGALWNYDHDYATQGPWYRCICDDRNYEELEISSKNVRHNLRRGLKRCSFRKIDCNWLADYGYEVYASGATRFKNTKVDSIKKFADSMLERAQFPNSEAFGVFMDDKLIAYMTVFTFGKSAWGDTASFDPAYSNLYPMYVLYYMVAYHYIRERGFIEFDRGSRPLVHETQVDEFLLRLGYRKAYCRLGVYFAWPIRVVLGIARIFRKVYGLILPSRYRAILDGLLLAQDTANATNVKINHVENVDLD